MRKTRRLTCCLSYRVVIDWALYEKDKTDCLFVIQGSLLIGLYERKTRRLTACLSYRVVIDWGLWEKDKKTDCLFVIQGSLLIGLYVWEYNVHSLLWVACLWLVFEANYYGLAHHHTTQHPLHHTQTLSQPLLHFKWLFSSKLITCLQEKTTGENNTVD